LQSDLREAVVDLGVIYAQQSRNTDALTAFKRAVQLDPTQPDAHYRLGRLYTALGQKEDAQMEFNKTKDLHSKVEDSLIEKISGDASVVPK
jgi:Tfp pilus assembly protein PilF